MSTSHPYQNPNSNPTIDEQRWIIHIRRSLDEDLDQESDIPVSIFNVPKTLLLSSPESYVPQQIALGPYHHYRPELYEMERYKLSAAKRFQKHIPGLRFHTLVDHLILSEPKFRAFYQKYLNFNGETLAWMMAIDSCFLLEFLRTFSLDLVDATGRRPGHDAIIRDMLMLENQIPLFSLRKMMEFQFASPDEADDMFYSILMGLCNEISPFKTIKLELSDFNHVTKCAHLLDLLYHFIVPKSELSSEIEPEKEENNEGGEKTGLRKVMSKFGPGPVSLFKRLVISKPAKFILTLPLKIISNFPGMIVLRQFEYLWFTQENEICELNEKINNHPLMEEIAIPSVSELSKAGIKFSITNSGILGIEFNRKSATFYLPTICIDVNTEVVLRNLVAYEACDASGPLIFTRYTELMNGIIDSEDDAKLLRENGIVLNHLQCDGDVANLWNGMSRSVRLTKVPFLDRVIEDVNDYYQGRWRVKIGKFLKTHVFGSWRCMTLLGAVWLLFFMSLQSFCSIFGCVRMFYHRKMMN
ncbi:putative upf0481 protein at3g02645 [Phtheirospermum japonicum]|uniref:Putative upf0481 protein at3g02645 n=1 Tax=Phtheirospermum japonicum TaxID=374723 RepID=A0A830D8M6_9LAMI|nr:putative upf0481 protein at3g02645 [Phtheirospermum japonicum]